MRRVCMAALMALGMSLVWTVRVQAQGFTVARDEATGKYGYKANGIWIIDPEYDRAEAFSESMAVVRKDGKYGYIDVSGRLVIPVKYQDAGSFSAGLAPVCLYGKYGYVDKSGEMVVPFKYS